MFFIRRRSPGSTVAPQKFEVEDGGNTQPEPTMAQSARPLLTSMKLFGLYFRRGMEEGDNLTDEKLRCRWNGYMIYGLVVVILLWINVARMFSVFKDILFLA